MEFRLCDKSAKRGTDQCCSGFCMNAAFCTQVPGSILAKTKRPRLLAPPRVAIAPSRIVQVPAIGIGATTGDIHIQCCLARPIFSLVLEPSVKHAEWLLTCDNTAYDFSYMIIHACGQRVINHNRCTTRVRGLFVLLRII